jgi:hypothetical protein
MKILKVILFIFFGSILTLIASFFIFKKISKKERHVSILSKEKLKDDDKKIYDDVGDDF